MLKFRFERGRTLKALNSVAIYGKDGKALERALNWLCDHLVVEDNRTVTRTPCPEGELVTLVKEDDNLWVCGEIYTANVVDMETPSLVWRVVKLRNSRQYVLILEKPDLEFAYLLH